MFCRLTSQPLHNIEVNHSDMPTSVISGRSLAQARLQAQLLQEDCCIMPIMNTGL